MAATAEEAADRAAEAVGAGAAEVGAATEEKVGAGEAAGPESEVSGEVATRGGRRAMDGECQTSWIPNGGDRDREEEVDFILPGGLVLFGFEFGYVMVVCF